MPFRSNFNKPFLLRGFFCSEDNIKIEVTVFLSFLFKSGVCHSFMLCNLSTKKVSVTIIIIKAILNMILKAEKSLKCPLAGTKPKCFVGLVTNNVLSQVTVSFIVNFHLCNLNKAERSLKSPLAGTKQGEATHDVSSQVTDNFVNTKFVGQCVNEYQYYTRKILGGGGWPLHMKGGGMLVVLLKDVNFGFWSHFGSRL